MKNYNFSLIQDVIVSDRTSLTTHNKIQINNPNPKANTKQPGANSPPTPTKPKLFIEGKTGGHCSLNESPSHTHSLAVAGRVGDSSQRPHTHTKL